MLIGLASGNTFLDSWDENAGSKLTVLSNEVASSAKNFFYDLGDRPVWTESRVYGHRKFHMQDVRF